MRETPGSLDEGSPLVELAARLLETRDRGGDVESFLRRHAEHADLLREVVVQAEVLERHGDALAGPEEPAGVRALTVAALRRIADDAERVGDPEEGRDAVAEVLARSEEHAGAWERYAVERELARGGQGAILAVFDGHLERRLAMKVALASDPGDDGSASSAQSLGRFLEEAHVTAQLDHPGIVPVHDLGLGPDRRVYFTMKLVKGRDLRTILELSRRGEEGWSGTRVLGVMLKVCEAMAYAHAKGVIHRDLKPSNVMVGKYGEVYVMDWGLARVQGREDARDLRIRAEATEALRSTRASPEGDLDSPLVTMDGVVVGTPAYMSPEQALGDVEGMGPPSDVYAVGAMLYQLLSGQMPYVPSGSRLDNHAIWYHVQRGPPDPLHELAPDAPAELVAICEKAMARDRARRYADMSELSEDLRAFLEHRVVGAYEAGAVAELRKWVGRNKALAASLAAAVLVLVGGLAVALVLLGRVASERDSARAVALTNASAGEIGKDPMLAVLLAREAVRLRSSPATRSGLLAALDSLRERRQLRHPKLLASAVYSPDGERILTAADDTAYLWKPGGELLQEIGPHPSFLVHASYSPDGARILTATRLGSAWLWTDEGRRVAELPSPAGTDWGVVNLVASRAAAFSPDGERVCLGDRSGTVRVFNRDGSLLATLGGEHSEAVLCVAFSADGELVASGARDGSVVVWHRDGWVAQRLEHDADVSSVSFSPDGRTLLTSSRDGTARLWDPYDGAVLLSLAGGGGEVQSATFSPDGSLLATSGRTVRLWNLEGELLWARDYEANVWNVQFSPDGQLLVGSSNDGKARVHDLEGRLVTELLGHQGRTTSAVFSPSGESVLTASIDGTARVWNVSSAGFPTLPGDGQALATGAFSPDGARSATGSRSGRGRIWDAAGHLLAELEPEGCVTHVSWSASGDRLVSCHDTGTVRLWDADGRSLGRFRVGTRGTQSAAFSPDGARIVVGGGDDKRLSLWALHGDALEHVTDFGAGEWWYDARFSPDGHFILASSVDKVELWTATGEPLDSLRLSSNRDAMWCLAFSADGQRALVGLRTGEVVVLAVTGGRLQELGRFTGPGKAIHCVSYSPSGELVAAGAADGTVSLWTVDGDLLLTMHHGGIVWCVDFSPDGSRLLSTSSLGTARVWPVLTTDESLLELAAERATRGFRAEEIAKYADLLGPSVAPETADPLVTSGDLNQASWEIVREPGRSTEAYAEALRLAERADSVRPDVAHILNTLGVARYRVGRYREAVVALSRAAELNRAAERHDARAFDLVFLAMSRFRLGEEQEAARLVSECRELAADADDEELAGFLREAEELIGSD